MRAAGGAAMEVDKGTSSGWDVGAEVGDVELPGTLDLRTGPVLEAEESKRKPPMPPKSHFRLRLPSTIRC